MPKKKTDMPDPTMEPETNDAGETGGVFDEASQLEDFTESLFSEAAPQAGEREQKSEGFGEDTFSDAKSQAGYDEPQNDFTADWETERQPEDAAEQPGEDRSEAYSSLEDICRETSHDSPVDGALPALPEASGNEAAQEPAEANSLMIFSEQPEDTTDFAVSDFSELSEDAAPDTLTHDDVPVAAMTDAEEAPAQVVNPS
ncbi:hypothetical protein FACS1894191_3010 [Clostridia bacterium]|nr:hypothetical protein FACS1894191_3010 [Clostridia bacterium]